MTLDELRVELVFPRDEEATLSSDEAPKRDSRLHLLLLFGAMSTTILPNELDPKITALTPISKRPI